MKREQEYEDLDALVLAEIESIGRVQKRRTGDQRKDAVQMQRPLSSAQPTVIPLAKHGDGDHAAEGVSGEEAEALFELPVAEEFAYLVEVSEPSADALYSTEEQAFMSRAIDFLKGRDNADMILGQIWEQLTSDDPQAFYAAEDAPAGASRSDARHAGPGPVTDVDQPDPPED
jgi:hypothetical protein